MEAHHVIPRATDLHPARANTDAALVLLLLIDDEIPLPIASVTVLLVIHTVIADVAAMTTDSVARLVDVAGVLRHLDQTLPFPRQVQRVSSGTALCLQDVSKYSVALSSLAVSRQMKLIYEACLVNSELYRHAS
jgi:hypothetical protein